MPLVPFQIAETTVVGALQAAGAPRAFAATQAALLLEAELRGTPSHGLLRLPRIIRRIANGVIDPTTAGVHEWRAPGFLAVDGQAGLGAVVGVAALEQVMTAAIANGVAIAAVSNNNHIGMLAWYAERAAAGGLAAIVLTTSEALVHPWGGRRPMIGTNPIAIGVPTARGPFVADIATGVVSMGKIHDHAYRKAPLQPGWAVDAAGEPTLDAQAAKAGAIAPFGQAKGYALGLAFEVLVTSLTGAALGTAVRGTLDAEHVCNKGDVFIAIDPGAGQGAAIAAYLDAMRACAPAEGFDVVRVPGDRSRQVREQRMAVGMPVADEVWTEIQALAAVRAPGERGSE